MSRTAWKPSPLAEYAAEYWICRTFRNLPPNTQDGMKCLSDLRKYNLAISVWIHDPVYPWRSECPTQASGTPLHYAAYCGIFEIIRSLVVECSQDVYACGFDRNETPLGVIPRRGHAKVARVHLEHAANPRFRDKTS
ncbi:hypothetical protein BC827DRAFT_706998 [Russula dissimulans]|nr:hypothetical protein BC827DRAFT_706998 [Russula dissimulans]